MFVATLKSLLRHTCLGWSHVSSTFCRDIIFFYRDRDFCLVFFTVSQLKFLCLLLNFFHDSSRLCRNRVLFNLMLCLSQLKILCHDKVFLSFIADSKCCVATYNLPWSCHKLKCLLQHRKFFRSYFDLICLCFDIFCREINLHCCDKAFLPFNVDCGFCVVT